MMDNGLIELKATRVIYYSEQDEECFFTWLSKILCVKKIQGDLDTIYIHIDKNLMDEVNFRELIGIFKRYNISMSQLQVFNVDKFKPWFNNKRSYWYKDVFGN